MGDEPRLTGVTTIWPAQRSIDTQKNKDYNPGFADITHKGPRRWATIECAGHKILSHSYQECLFACTHLDRRVIFGVVGSAGYIIMMETLCCYMTNVSKPASTLEKGGQRNRVGFAFWPRRQEWTRFFSPVLINKALSVPMWWESINHSGPATMSDYGEIIGLSLRLTDVHFLLGQGPTPIKPPTHPIPPYPSIRHLMFKALSYPHTPNSAEFWFQQEYPPTPLLMDPIIPYPPVDRNPGRFRNWRPIP